MLFHVQNCPNENTIMGMTRVCNLVDFVRTQGGAEDISFI